VQRTNRLALESTWILSWTPWIIFRVADTLKVTFGSQGSPNAMSHVLLIGVTGRQGMSAWLLLRDSVLVATRIDAIEPYVQTIIL